MKQIIELETKLLTAFENCDLATLEELLHDSCLFVLPNGSTVNKIQVLANYRSGHTSMNKLLATEQTINLLNDTAIVTVNISMTGKYADQVINSLYRYLRVWQLTDQTWKVIAVSGVPISSKIS